MVRLVMREVKRPQHSADGVSIYFHKQPAWICLNISPGPRILPIKLAVFDVDGTLLRGDTICQTIARGLGKYERMCELEELSTVDEIIAGREEMAGWYMEAGREESVSFLADLNWAPGAREGVEELRQAGVQVALASVTWSFAVARVASELEIDDFRSTELDFATGAISHTWGTTKAEYLRSLASERGVSTSETAAIGDTNGDLDMLDAAGRGIFVGERPPPGIAGVTHMPAADIRDVAAGILAQ